MRELSANTGGELSDLFSGSGAIEPSHQRTMQRGWNRRLRYTAAQDIAIDPFGD